MTARETYHRIRIVDSFEDLIAFRFDDNVNAICWRRHLPGDFRNIVEQIRADDTITTIDDDDLRALTLTSAGAQARDVLLADQALLRRHGLAPSLDFITGYARDGTLGPISTDVYSFHVDSAPVPADTYLCTYVGCSSEGLANEDAVRHVDVPETRAQLLNAYGGADDEAFDAHLSERCFDLHYTPRPGARPFTFGPGNLWRIAIAYPGSPALPCIHRAPLTLAGDPARLLLIS